MAFPTLPPKYYLAHFFEFLEFLETHYHVVMEPSHKNFLMGFRSLSEEAQCVYVRMVNRKGSVFDREVFKKYSEIKEPLGALLELEDKGFASALHDSDRRDLIHHLTKPKLLKWLRAHDLNVLASLSKDEIIDVALEYLSKLEVSKLSGYEQVTAQRRLEEMEYLSFLFFGQIQKSLNLYTLRDLGIRKSDTLKSKFKPRFQILTEAKSEFFFAQQLDRFYELESINQYQELFRQTLKFQELKASTQSLKDELLLKIANHILDEDENFALQAYAQSQHPEARMKAIKHLYKVGQKEKSRELLEQALEDPRDDVELLFAEDFINRKFEKSQGRKLGYLTELIRSSPEVTLSEFYLKRAELGVCDYFQKRGYTAVFSENHLWLSLFGVLFWQELFESEEAAIHSPFERSPSDLVGAEFYNKNREGIETKLSQIKNIKATEMSLLKTITENFGRLNDIFQWHPKLAESVLQLVRNSVNQDLAHILRTMAQKFEAYHTGFPDVMIQKEGKIKFIEVKAEGDSLRANQLSKIRLLKEAGFEVEVLRVRWKSDPNQTYVVIDVETTGGTASTHRVTEVGAVKIQNGEVIEEFQTLINPGRSIPPFITQITGITDEMVKEAPRFEDIAEKLLDFMEGSIFVAHNVKFDYGFIQREFERAGIEFVRPCICTCSGMRKAYPGIPSYGLKALTDHFEISLDTHHRALCDARAAAELLKLMNHKRAESEKL